MHFDTNRLTNGLTIHYQERDVPFLHAVLLLHVGSRDDLPGKEGTAHVLEHHLSNGTQGKPLRNLMELFSWGQSQGLQLMLGTTGPEGMWFNGTSAVDKAPCLLEFLLDHVLRPSFEGDLAKDRDIVRQERAQKMNDRERNILRECRLALYGDHRLATMNGAPEDAVLDGLTQRDLRNMHERFFNPRAIEIVGIGGVPCSAFVDLVNRKTETMIGATRPDYETFVPDIPRVSKHVFERETSRPISKVEIVLNWTVPADVSMRSQWALTVLTLFYLTKIREEMKASYGFRPGRIEYHDHTQFTLSTGVAPDKTNIVLDALRTSLDDRATLKQSFDDLVVRTRLGMQLMDETSAKTCEAAREQLMSRGAILTIADQMAEFDRWTFDECQETIATWLSHERQYCSLIEH